MRVIVLLYKGCVHHDQPCPAHNFHSKDNIIYIFRHFVRKLKVKFQILYYLSILETHAYLIPIPSIFYGSPRCEQIVVVFSLLIGPANWIKKLLKSILISDVNIIDVQVEEYSTYVIICNIMYSLYTYKYTTVLS